MPFLCGRITEQQYHASTLGSWHTKVSIFWCHKGSFKGGTFKFRTICVGI
jgi:hypothetical protein